jgi:hypothetical protein
VAQFDVFMNPGRQRNEVPYFVVLQNARFDRTHGRFVAPLKLRGNTPHQPHYLAPHFVINGQDVFLDVFSLVTIPAERLGLAVGSLADDESRMKLVRALDEFLSQV